MAEQGWNHLIYKMLNQNQGFPFGQSDIDHSCMKARHIGNISLVCIADNGLATPWMAVWSWSQILFCCVCANCISVKDFNFSLESIFYCCIF